jgi:hypothetical protein
MNDDIGSPSAATLGFMLCPPAKRRSRPGPLPSPYWIDMPTHHRPRPLLWRSLEHWFHHLGLTLPDYLSVDPAPCDRSAAPRLALQDRSVSVVPSEVPLKFRACTGAGAGAKKRQKVNDGRPVTIQPTVEWDLTIPIV